MPAGAVDPPGDWERHVDRPWTWYAPQGWIAAAGPYDLNISSPTGVKWVKFGFSAAPVDATKTDAANAAAWFAYWPAHMRSGSVTAPAGLYSKILASDRYTGLGAIQQLPATQLYRTRWRERVTFAGVRPNSKRIKGEMVMDYSVSVYGDSGAESFQIRSAPKRVYGDVIGTLRLVQQLIFYCGTTC
jgi:hypothetical protein